MIASMTGFGSASGDVAGGQVSVIARSVNHRYLDVSVSLPRRLAALEPRVKQLVQGQLARGRVELMVRAVFEPGAGTSVQASRPLVAALVRELRALRDEHALAGDVAVSDLARFPGTVELVEAAEPLDEAVGSEVLAVVAEAVAQLERMRRDEGARLAQALVEIVAAVEAGAREIEALVGAEAEGRRAALGERVRELVGELGLDEGRLYQEVVRLVDRSDVAEELQRLRSHCHEARQRLVAGGPCGKPLDFLAQELMREANTIGSKSASAAITARVVALKAVIERFREQVQNVE